MLSLRALKDLNVSQKELGWTDDEKYKFAAREIIVYEQDEVSATRPTGKDESVESLPLKMNLSESMA